MNPIKLANPVNVTKGAFSAASTAVGLASAAVGKTAHVLESVLDQLGGADEVGTSAEMQGGPTTAAAAAAAVTDVDSAPPGPTVAPVEPHAPAEPPVDVVGETLAAEAAAERGEDLAGAGLAHEPRGASRDEEHGEAALQRAEVDEISAEAAAALEGDVEPETHLSEPLLDPAEAKATASALRTMSKAADPDKG
jgi:hypothetical protein